MTSKQGGNSLIEKLTAAGSGLQEGPIAPQLLRLTIPMLLGISSMMIASLIDTWYVGQIGTVELAAMTLTFPFVMALTSLSMGLGIGATSIISRTVGGGGTEKAQLIATHTLVLVVVFVAIIVSVGFAGVETVLMSLGAQEELLPIAIKYTYITLIGVPVLAIPMVGSMMLRAFNDVRTPAIIMMAGAGLQVLLAPVLIWGIGNWEGYGVYGSAWAFVWSRVVVAVFALYMFKVRGFIQVIKSWREFCNSSYEVLKLALPSIGSQMLMPLSMYLVMMLVASYENHVVAAFGVVTRIEALALMVIMALSSSMGPFVGQNFGAQRIDRIKSALQLCYRFCLVWGVLLAGVFFLWGADIVALFRDDAGVIGVAQEFFLIVPITMGLMSVSMISSSTFVAYGNPVPSMVTSITRMFLLLIPFCYLLEHFLGYQGIFLAMALTNVFSGVIAYTWLKARTAKHERNISTSQKPIPEIAEPADWLSESQ